MKWEVSERRSVVDNRWLKVTRDVCTRPDGSLVDGYYVVHGGNWVNVTPVTTEGQLVLVREYRHGFGEVLLGLPGGLIDDDDPSSCDAARRELAEEVHGLKVLLVEQTARMVVNPSTHTNTGYSCMALVAPIASAKVIYSGEPDIEVELHDFCEIIVGALGDKTLMSGFDAASLLRAFFRLGAHRELLTQEFNRRLGMLAESFFHQP